MPKIKDIQDYPFAEKIRNRIRSITDLFDVGKIGEAQIEIAKLAIEVCEKIESGTIEPKEGDEYFTLLDVYLSDNYPELELSEAIEDICFEGMILHDLGKSYGADIKRMRETAEAFLKE